MDDVTQFVIRHSSLVLFAAVLAEQVGLPIPAFPLLLAAGALAGAGQISLGMAVGVSVAACLVGDSVWYYLGRYRGRHVLNVLCRISLEPDSCIRRTETFFGRNGMWSLVLANFIPGLSTVTPALAGLFGVSVERFLFYTGLGALLWTVAYIAPGYLFSDQLEQIAAQAARFSGSLIALIAGALALYIAYKYIHRQLLLRKLRIARITADELKRMMDDGHEMMIVDLRQPLDIQADPYTIPGALPMAVEELEQRHHEIPRDRDVILYCACPNEATAARMALLLKKNGITRVRPLAGGVEAWRQRNFPLEEVGVGVA
jgi:membrane protein DedA with SNARE-associated domain/rhodanese-related sulfurtransferase